MRGFVTIAAAAAVAWVGGAPANALTPTAAEDAAFQSAELGKYVRAREQAEEILSADPASIPARYVMASVFYSWEANHARALRYARDARHRLEARWGRHPEDAKARIWHKRLLTVEIYVLGEMDRKAEQLDIIDVYDAIYAPKLTRFKVWPLMKLGRLKEAEKIGRELILSADVGDRISGYNGLMALEDEALNRRASYDWGKAGIAATQERSCILMHNTAQSAAALFKFDEAERLARKALTVSDSDCPNPSYTHLVVIYMVQGQFQKAISAFKKLVRYPIDRRYRPQFLMSNRASLVTILLALGKGEAALDYAEQIFEAPDRTGMTSASVADVQFLHGVNYWLAMEQRIEELADAASVRDFFDSIALRAQIRQLELRQWEVARTVLRHGVEDDILVNNLRPLLRGVLPWAAGSLAKMLGKGLVHTALADARERDAAIAEESAAYYDAVVGEIAYHDGDWAKAVALGERALRLMQPAMRTMAWRTRAYVGGAHLALGDVAAATPHLREVLHKYPTALRQLGVAVPVTVTSSGGDVGHEVTARLVGSRRFDVQDGPEGAAPFGIQVGQGPDAVRICLTARDGFRYNCGSVELTAGYDVETQALKAIDAFMSAALSPKVALTNSDINSLDGSTVRVNADQVLEGLVGPPKKDQGEGE